MGCKMQTAIVMFHRTHVSQLACMYRFGASAGHMCMQGIMSGAYLLHVYCMWHITTCHSTIGVWASAAALRSLTMGNCLCFCYCLRLHVHYAQLGSLEPWLA